MCVDSLGNTVWKNILAILEPGVVPSSAGAFFKGWRRNFSIKDTAFYTLVGSALAMCLAPVIHHRISEDLQFTVFLLLGYFAPEILDALDLIKAQDIKDFVADRLRNRK